PSEVLGVFPPLAVTGGDRFMLAFSVSTLAVLTGGALVRRAARRRPRESAQEPETEPEPSGPGRRSSRSSRGVRRRAGSLVALGPIIGLAAGGSPTKLTVVAAVGAVALAALGLA